MEEKAEIIAVATYDKTDKHETTAALFLLETFNTAL